MRFPPQTLRVLCSLSHQLEVVLSTGAQSRLMDSHYELGEMEEMGTE